MVYVTGIDCSSWQDSELTPQRIDWTKPALYGVKFVINRAVFSTTKDQDFDYNWQQQKGHYIRGAYGFWGYWPGAASVEDQALALTNILKPDPGEMPVVWLDVEKANSSYPELPARSVSLPLIERYMKTVEDGIGLGMGIYTNLAGIARLSPIPQWLLDKPLWLAWPVNWNEGETVEAYIERTGTRPPVKEWTACKFWQYSWKGPGKAMGMESNDLDMDYFMGNETDLHNWCNGVTLPEGEPMDWTKNAIGFISTSGTEAAWSNDAFNFVVGHAGGNWTEKSPGVYEMEPNPNLKPIELQARVKGKVFLALWEFDVDYYTRGQYMADEQHWPPEANDYPLQRMIDALKNRDFDGLIIRLMNRNNLDGNPEMMSYIAFAAKKFIERANKWLYQNKGLNKWTFVLTNDTFLRLDGKQENFYTWLKDWHIGIEQEAVRPLASGAWPQATDKIKAVPPSLGWKLWYHYNASNLDMMIYNGTIEDMRGFLQTEATEPEPPVEPPTGDYVPRAEFDALAGRVTEIETKLAAAKAAL